MITAILIDVSYVAETLSGCETPGYACYGCPKASYCENAFFEESEDEG